jgi:hypothetical protein
MKKPANIERKAIAGFAAAPLLDIKAPITKPPLGLRPRWIAEEQRLIEVASAASRYLDAGKTVPPPWIEEMIHLIGSIEHWRSWKQRDAMMSNDRTELRLAGSAATTTPKI